MARDLIPPASPAGRPAPDGTPNLIELPPEPPRSGAAPAQQGPPPGPSEFRNRFGFLLGALAGVVIAAVLVLVVLVASGHGSTADPGLAANWSKWQPVNTSIDEGAAEIAKKVGAEYRHPNGQQLVLVNGGEIPAGLHVALQPASGNIAEFKDPGVLYNLNGLGPNGSIIGGKPSPARLQLIRREALELALYTFRYLPDVKQVVTLLPPPPPKEGDASALNPITGQQDDPNTRTAVFYRPGDLKLQLQTPLGVTLPARTPNPDTMAAAPEAKRVDALTQSNVFKWSVSAPQGGAPVLVLRR